MIIGRNMIYRHVILCEYITLIRLFFRVLYGIFRLYNITILKSYNCGRVGESTDGPRTLLYMHK